MVLEKWAYFRESYSAFNRKCLTYFACAAFSLVLSLTNYWVFSFSSPEPLILLACGRNRELWEQPFQTCAIDADCVRPDGQNSVICFVISKWLLPELLIPAAGQKDRRLWGREWVFFCIDTFSSIPW